MIKLSKNGITTLKKQYKSVLLKCMVINAGVFMLAMPAMAEDLIVNGNQNIDATERFNYGKIVVNHGAELTITDSDIKTTAKTAASDDIVVKGKLNVSNSTLEAGNDSDGAPNNSNILFDGATVDSTDSDIEANGNVTISNANITLTTDNPTEDDEVTGIWAEKNLTVTGGNITLNDSYLAAGGDINISGGKFVAIGEALVQRTQGNDKHSFNISGGEFELGSEADIDSGTYNFVYNGVTADLNISGGKISAKDGTEINVCGNADMNISGGEINMDYTDYEENNGHDGGILHEGKKGNINISGGTINLTGKVAKIERGGYDGDWIYDKDGNALMDSDEFYEKTSASISYATDEMISEAGLNPAVVDKSKYHVSSGDINIIGGTLNLKDGARISTTAKNTGDINISGSAKLDLNESEIRSLGNLNVQGGTIKLLSKNGEAGHQNMSGLNSQGYVQTGNNLGLVAAKNINISGGEIILNGESIDAMGDINFTGGMIDSKESETANTLWAAGNINLNGGTINVADYMDVNTFYANKQDGKFVPVDASKGQINIDGATINLAKDAWVDFESTNKVTFNSGTINVAEDAGFSVYNTLKENMTPDEHGIYQSGFYNEDVIGTLYAGKASTINLNNGELDANYIGNGQINITGAKGYLNGNTQLTDGGVMNIGTNQAVAEGDVTFEKGATLNMAITDNANGSLSANKLTAKEGSTLNLNITKKMEKDESASFKLFETKEVDNKFTNVADNARYQISTKDGATYNVTYTASASDVVEEVGGTANNAATAEAWDSLPASAMANETTKAVAETLNKLSQENPQAYTDALTALAPETAPATIQAASETAGAVFGAVGSRLSGGSVSSSQGMSSGDALRGVALWAQGMYNHAKLDSNEHSKGFDSDTWGAALGIEKQINSSVKAGIGYAYSKTDIDGFMRDTDVKTHSALVYGEYKPSNWYANAVATYGWSDYEEDKNVAGVKVKSDYDVEALGLQALTGYDIHTSAATVTPEAGLRYLHIRQKTYTDTAGQKVLSNNSDVWTGVFGAKANKTYKTSFGALKPELRAALTYDLAHDNANSTVVMPNGSSYSVSGKPLNRFGFEVGAGVTTEISNSVELSLMYEGKFRKDYRDHSGVVSAKYKF